MTESVRLSCAEHGCTESLTVDRRHVDNLTARGVWRCLDHRTEPPEVPC